MVTYRHSGHAGNHGDVLKHVVLSRLLQHSRASFVDLHAGAGRYELSDIGPWQDGVGRIVDREDTPAMCDNYLQVIRQLNPGGPLRHYPGSPELASRLTSGVPILLCDNDPAASAALTENYLDDPRITVCSGDGWSLVDKLPAAPGFLLIDPPYQNANDPLWAISTFRSALAKWPKSIVMLWYPVEADRDLRLFQEIARETQAVRAELLVKPVSLAAGLAGSGVIIGNCPRVLVPELEEALPWLAVTLSGSTRNEATVDTGKGD